MDPDLVLFHRDPVGSGAQQNSDRRLRHMRKHASALLMSAKKRAVPSDPANPVQLNIRVSRDLESEIDRWTAEHNLSNGTRIGRADLLRGVISWAVKARPDCLPK